MGTRPVGKIFLRRGRTTEGKPVFATMWKTKLGSTFYMTGKTRKYLNKETQKSRIVFSESIGKTDGDIMDEPVRVRQDQEEEEKEPKVDYTRQYE